MPATQHNGWRVLWTSAGGAAPRMAAVCAGHPELSIDAVGNVLDALQFLERARMDAVVVELPQPDWSGAEILEEIQRIDPQLPVLLCEPSPDMAQVVRLTKLGAFQVLGEDVPVETLASALQSACEDHHTRKLAQLGAQVEGEAWRRVLVGESRAMQNVAHLIRLVGKRRCTVLITGETGTGKELAARALHLASPRAALPMVAVNCSALPENLLEAELFGHVKGAYTGAVTNRAGRFEQAHNSTLFLDEVGELPLDLQAKLLRVLQEREFQRLGSSETIKVDVRVIAATNVDLEQRVRDGRFREDLYYRLNVVPLRMPPLRARATDIPLLVYHFVEKICRLEGVPEKTATREAVERLCTYSWPGNVRQLENAVEVAIALSGDRQELHPGDFPLPSLAASKPPPALAIPVLAVPDEGMDFESTMQCIERSVLEQAMRKTNGNKKQAADMLRLKRTTLSAKLRSLALHAEAAEM